MVPKLSAPLTKAIRTSEGIAVWVLNIALGIASSIPQTHLSVKEAGILATITTGIHVASRTMLKVTAVSKGLGAPEIPFTPPAAVQKVITAGTAAAPKVIYDVEKDLAEKPSVIAVEEQAAELVGDTTEFATQPPPPQPAGTDTTTPAASAVGVTETTPSSTAS